MHRTSNTIICCIIARIVLFIRREFLSAKKINNCCTSSFTSMQRMTAHSRTGIQLSGHRTRHGHHNLRAINYVICVRYVNVFLRRKKSKYTGTALRYVIGYVIDLFFPSIWRRSGDRIASMRDRRSDVSRMRQATSQLDHYYTAHLQIAIDSTDTALFVTRQLAIQSFPLVRYPTPPFSRLRYGNPPIACRRARGPASVLRFSSSR